MNPKTTFSIITVCCSLIGAYFLISDLLVDVEFFNLVGYNWTTILIAEQDPNLWAAIGFLFASYLGLILVRQTERAPS